MEFFFFDAEFHGASETNHERGISRASLRFLAFHTEFLCILRCLRCPSVRAVLFCKRAMFSFSQAFQNRAGALQFVRCLVFPRIASRFLSFLCVFSGFDAFLDFFWRCGGSVCPGASCATEARLSFFFFFRSFGEGRLRSIDWEHRAGRALGTRDEVFSNARLEVFTVVESRTWDFRDARKYEALCAAGAPGAQGEHQALGTTGMKFQTHGRLGHLKHMERAPGTSTMRHARKK